MQEPRTTLLLSSIMHVYFLPTTRMIQVISTEQRTLVVPGKPTMTILREVNFKNGKGRKTLRVLRNGKVISTESESLNQVERKKVHQRKFVKGLYKKMERQTRKRLA